MRLSSRSFTLVGVGHSVGVVAGFVVTSHPVLGVNLPLLENFKDPGLDYKVASEREKIVHGIDLFDRTLTAGAGTM